MTFDNREAARVKSVTADKEDHGILTSYIHVEGPEGGWGQGFGGLAFDGPHLEAWKADICALFGVKAFEDIVGRNCFVLRNWPSWGSPIEGLEVDGRRFTLTDFRRRHWPDKTVTPLEAKARELRNSIAYAGRDVQRFVGELEKVADGYVDWSTPTGGAASSKQTP